MLYFDKKYLRIILFFGCSFSICNTFKSVATNLITKHVKLTKYFNAIFVDDDSVSDCLRIDAKKITMTEFQANFETRWPVVLTNIFDIDNELSVENLVERLANRDVLFDIRRSSDGHVETFEASLADFITSLNEESTHEESWYMMDEQILVEDGLLLSKLKLPQHLFGFDLFSYFPKKIQPKSALIIGGEGARSFLHIDPYEWTGWNYLFEGKKLWVFYPPDTPEEYLDCHRNAPDAWGNYNLSAGWVSDIDLYRNRQFTKTSKKIDVNIKNDSIGINLLGKLSQEIIAAFEDESSTSTLTDLPAFNSETENNLEKDVNNIFNPTSPVPSFTSGTDFDSLIDPRLMSGGGRIQIIQREGEMVVIPPKWWHQVYHLEPSIAVAGQYFTENGRDRLFRHIMDWCDTKLESLPSDFTSLTSEEQIKIVLHESLKAKHGEEIGEEMFIKLFSSEKSGRRLGRKKRKE